MPVTDPIVQLLAQVRAFSFEVILWLAALVAACALLGVVALAIRRRLLGRDQSSPVGFTLADLRRLHAEGQLSDEELAAAEARTLARSRSHYLGDPEASESDLADAGAGSSTNDPPPQGPGAENLPGHPDKNGGGGPV